MATAGEERPQPFGVVLVDAARGDVRLEAKTSVGTEGCFRSIDLTLRWQESDPLTVWIDVEAKPDHPALPRGRWLVLRDFLRYGIDQPTGDGDVRRIWKCRWCILIWPGRGGPAGFRSRSGCSMTF
jgi:hypothetical protein